MASVMLWLLVSGACLCAYFYVGFRLLAPRWAAAYFEREITKREEERREDKKKYPLSTDDELSRLDIEHSTMDTDAQVMMALFWPAVFVGKAVVGSLGYTPSPTQLRLAHEKQARYTAELEKEIERLRKEAEHE